MIEEGQIFARINQADGMVSFLEDPEEATLICVSGVLITTSWQYKTNAMMTNLDERIRAHGNLYSVLNGLNSEVHNHYIFLCD